MNILLQFIMTLVAVSAPMGFYALIIWSIDRFEHEPLWCLAAAFFWGAVPAVIGSVVFTSTLYPPLEYTLGTGAEARLYALLAMAPAVEECFKAGAVFMMYCLYKLEFDGWIDGLVYGAMAGFGFGFVENMGYLLFKADTYNGWISIYLTRVIVFGFMHGFYTGLTGIGFGLAREERDPTRRSTAIFGFLLLAILAHSIHNAGCLISVHSASAGMYIALINYTTMVAALIIVFYLSTHLTRKELRKLLRDEAPDVLSSAEYKKVCSLWCGGINVFHPGWRKSRRLVQLSAELAQKKRQLARMGDETGNNAEIERLREELRRFTG